MSEFDEGLKEAEQAVEHIFMVEEGSTVREAMQAVHHSMNIVLKERTEKATDNDVESLANDEGGDLGLGFGNPVGDTPDIQNTADKAEAIYSRSARRRITCKQTRLRKH